MSPGQYGDGDVQEIPLFRPSPMAGWGRVDLVGSINPGEGQSVWVKDVTQGLSTGGSSTFQLTVGGGQLASGSAPVQAYSESAHATASNLIQNGGFESDAAWVMESFERENAFSYAEDWSAVSWPGFDGYVYQFVDIPADATAATLSYYWYNEDADPGFDELAVSIYSDDLGSVLETFAFHSSDDQEWHGESFNLNGLLDDLRGETVAVVLEIIQDGIEPDAVFYVDDVALMVETGDGNPTATPTPISQPGPTPTQPPGGSDNLRVTLVWTDFPGVPSAAKALVNDLDMEIIGPDGARYVGNAGLYADGQCLRGGGWDACNNVGGVILDNAPAGVYRIVVYGRNIPEGLQPFALAAVGSALREDGDAQPTQTPVPGLNRSVYLPLITR